MKKTLFLLFTMLGLLLLPGCGSANKATDADKELLKQYVQQTVGSRYYTIMVDNSGHKLIVKKDQVVSNLPYVGTGTDVGYGGGGFKSLNFTGRITDYTIIYPSYPKDKKADIRFKANSGEDVYEFHVEVFYNGKAFIDVVPRGRTPQSYKGVLLVQ